MRFDRNPEYWRPGEPISIASWRGSSAMRRRAARRWQTSEINYGGFNAIPYFDVARLTKVAGIASTTKGYEMQSPIVELDFNTRVKPFDDVRVRQAISISIDRKFVIDNIWFGFGKPATGPISSNFKPNGIYTSDVRNYNLPNGADVANKMLDEAGYKRKADGTRFEIVHDVTPYGDEWQRFGEYVKQALAKIGIKATIRYEDVPTWLRRIYTDYDFQLTSNWVQNLADPVIGIDRLYSSWSIKKGTIFVNGSGLEPPGDRPADEGGGDRDRSGQARRALSPVPEAGRGRRAAGLGVRAAVRDGVQHEIQGPHGESARSVCAVQQGVARCIAPNAASRCAARNHRWVSPGSAPTSSGGGLRRRYRRSS